MLSVVSNVLWSRETPISEPSDLAIYKLAEMARREVTVVLSGEGSDEILGGYPKYKAERKLAAIPFSQSVLSAAARVAPKKSERLSTLATVLAQQDPFERYARWFGAFGSTERASLLGKNVRTTCSSRDLAEDFAKSEPADLMMYLDFYEWLPANLLLRGDRMTMAHSLELRCPFLDHRLVEHVISKMPADFRLRGTGGKYPLRALANRYLPEDIGRRQKWGFKLPVGTWLRGPWRHSFETVVLDPRSGSSRWYQPSAVRRLWEQHLTGAADHSKKLWCLFQVELWYRMFIKRELNPGDLLPEQGFN
jgi:asparagine synthase (glutamine-hydrolysing)